MFSSVLAVFQAQKDQEVAPRAKEALVVEMWGELEVQSDQVEERKHEKSLALFEVRGKILVILGFDRGCA